VKTAHCVPFSHYSSLASAPVRAYFANTKCKRTSDDYLSSGIIEEKKRYSAGMFGERASSNTIKLRTLLKMLVIQSDIIHTQIHRMSLALSYSQLCRTILLSSQLRASYCTLRQDQFCNPTPVTSRLTGSNIGGVKTTGSMVKMCTRTPLSYAQRA